ncbi:MAG: NADP-dependent glyceraldehyde-3-phosphate dehydrogenase [Deltaproteobacteria bacterium HGW-Deltaproteobacteria-4]|nr:MAG: NADP-dependent glyceraldehyde-3-phosphate dehydrogenase [Deltaproteobacteria bacterium HGW-Deltaproteobacteria-4]
MTKLTTGQGIFPHNMEAIPAEYRQERFEQRHYLINGELRLWNGPFQEVSSPICFSGADGPQQVAIGAFPLLGETESLAALAAAVAAYDHGRGLWPTMTVAERIDRVQRFTLRMRGERETIVRLMMWEIGKTLSDAQKEFDRTVTYIDDTIDALKDLDRISSRFTIVDGILGQIRRAPLGVTLCLGPFNYPLNETFTTLIPALIMGNTVIFKPPRHGVLLFGPLLPAFRDSFPPGVVNAIFGAGRTIIPPLMSSGRVDAFAFIGTSGAADTLQKIHPRPHRLRLVLGLEAKNPAIVLADADLELAVRECVSGALSFNGQRCTALKILFVQRAVAADFVDRLAAAVADLRCNLPWEEGAAITPLPEEGKAGALTALIADAIVRGAVVVNPGGGTVYGTLFTPAVLYPVAAGMRLYTEEQFGPIVPVVPFDDVEEVVHYITESNYGQQVSLFGRDPVELATLIDPLVNQVCRVNINSQCQRGPDVFPFTGRKDSAVATLSVSDALRAFSIRTLVAARDVKENREIIREIVQERHSKFLSTDFIL